MEIPAIVVYCSPDGDSRLVEALLLGCEEEGVPAIVHRVKGAAEILARAAATVSFLFIGIGLDESGAIVIHEHRLGDRPPVQTCGSATTAEARAIGTMAGRMARGRPAESVVSCNDVQSSG